MSSSKPLVLSSGDWNTQSVKYMPPKVNAMGGKSINMISTQTNRSLHISTPMMMTWGITDFIGDNGESDGKFTMSLNFPNSEYRKPVTDAFLEKVKAFENQILDDAVKNSELWWGEEMSREVCKHSFFPFLKYNYIKGTKKIDATKPPSIRAKVPLYQGKWGVELYNTRDEMVFPCDNDRLTPVDFVPKLSQVACVLQCGGIWIGGKGWGVTWKVIQCVVKPREVVSVYGKCHIQLSDDDRGAIESQTIQDDVDEYETSASAEPPRAATVFESAVAHSTEAADSDEEEVEVAPAPVVAKKVVKKVAPAAPVEVEAPSAAPKKKIVKKKPLSASEDA
jgi:hypothetical protein